ncbi:MAG: 1-deoxy-D-xylulose-5-phosphate synthase [Acidobacteria bacterium]|nr:1-deoxy-D-xylulose-5-phosphate synthase [Acidobacteriota bacterium]
MARLLDKINSPDDIKKMNFKQLKQLAGEIRELIITTVSKNGGHLASNLGVIELTLAMHYVFDFKKDRLVWDVGHQCYTHKIITGRKDSFHTLRQYRGISGFPKIEESQYDHLNTGHSSTSISAALGMAVARDINGEDNNILAVCGDGALTAGIALEALNQVGHMKKRVILVLNDNEMSIGKNVGGIAGYLNRIISGQFYIRFNRKMKKMLKGIPGIGDSMVSMARAFEHLLKRMFVPGMLFEELGYKYVGPEDGHNIEGLIKTFEQVKTNVGPILLHVVTKKGKGYKPAEEMNEAFHGASPFDIKTGQFKKSSEPKPPSYTNIFGKTLCEIAEKNPKVVAITAAMREGTGLKEFSEKFQDRFFDVGIAEQHAVMFAGGLALGGMKPVVAIYSTFMQRAFDQLVHDASLMQLPIVFALDRAGLVGADGPTHHGVYDLSFTRMIPHFTIASPRDENELRHLLYTATNYDKPFVIRYPRGNGIGVPIDSPLRNITPGTAEKLKHGEDAVIFALGRMVYPALEVAKELVHEGIKVSVVDLRYLKPLDENLIINELQTSGRVITIEDNVLSGGMGGYITEFISTNIQENIPVLRIGLPDIDIEHGEVSVLDKKYGLDTKSIYNRTKEFIKNTKRRPVLKQNEPSGKVFRIVK